MEKVTINPKEIRILSMVMGVNAKAIRDVFGCAFSQLETIYISSVSLLLNDVSGEAMFGLVRCLFGILKRRVFVDFDGTEFPLPPHDPESREDPMLLASVDAFIGLYSYYLFSQGRVESPAQSFRPLSFLLYEVFDGLREGLNLETEVAKEQYETKKFKYEKFGDEAIAQWRAHFYFIAEQMGLTF